RFSIRSVLANTRPKDNGEGHSRKSTNRVYHGRSRKIDVAMPHTHRVSELRQPAAAPDPVSKNGVENGAHEHFAKQETAKRDPFADGSDDDIARGFHEHDLKQCEHMRSHVVGGAG